MDNLEKRATLKPSWVARNMELADRLELLGYRRETKALRCCGRARQFDGGDLFPNLPCNRKFCPACRAFNQHKKLGALQDRVLNLVIPDGAASFATLTLPGWVGGSISERTHYLRDSLATLRRQQTWKGPKGFKNDLGLVVGTEISCGAVGEGHPHLHALLAGRDPARVEAAGEWLLAGWHSQVPGASPSAQKVEAVEPHPEALATALGYLLKGSAVPPDLPEELLLGLVEELSSGRQHITVSGLFRTPRRKRRIDAESERNAMGMETESDDDPGEETPC